MRIAVLKLDHIGDFILSLPALHALHDNLGMFDLIASHSNYFLFNYFFSNYKINFVPVSMKYLSKNSHGIEFEDLVKIVADYDLIIILRNDLYMQQLYERFSGKCLIVKHNDDLHETLNQKNAITGLIGDYSRTLYFSKNTIKWPNNIKTLGLCISAGFVSNKLPLVFWQSLANFFIKKNIKIVLICGPAEIQEVSLLSRTVNGLTDTIIGSSNLKDFYEKLSKVDLVIGSDSGTLHLCSYKLPVLGLFTSSPWRIYAPFGKQNRILANSFSCSPCIQYSSTHLNACLLKICSLIYSNDIIERALCKNITDTGSYGGLTLYSGVSHLV